MSFAKPSAGKPFLNLSAFPGRAAFIGRAGPHVIPEEGMGDLGAGFELRMELAPQKPGVIGDFDDLYQLPVGRGAGDAQARLGQAIPVLVVKFIAVAVAL